MAVSVRAAASPTIWTTTSPSRRIPLNEPVAIDRDRRATVIAAYDAEGARADGTLSDLVDFAAALCDAPIALVSLVDEREQRFLARHGTDLEQTPRNISFCAVAMDEPDVMVVPDALADPRFADNPLVTAAPHVRFYAGAPLVSPEGVPLGAVCVLDPAPRAALTPLQLQGLRVLATSAMARLGDRRASREHRARERSTRRELHESERRFRTLADTMPQMVWSTLPDGYHDYYNARWYEFTGVPAGSTDGEAWNDMFHRDDQARAWEVWRHSLATGDPYQIEYRLKHFDGTYRWVLGRALPIRDEAGAITRWFGTCTDIHEQKLAMEERELISQELAHRIKNIFAVIAGLVQVSARGRPEFASTAADLRDRITALGRAHDFVRPHSDASRPSAHQDSLHGLLADLLAPYQYAGSSRIAIEGDDLPIDDRSATPLALLFHELATNANKYGALANGDGSVTILIDARETEADLIWRERNGRTITPSTDRGFGSQLIELAAERQLGGRIARDWASEGLTVTVTVPRAALSRRD